MDRTMIAARYEHPEFLLRSFFLQLRSALRCPEMTRQTGPIQPAR